MSVRAACYLPPLHNVSEFTTDLLPVKLYCN